MSQRAEAGAAAWAPLLLGAAAMVPAHLAGAVRFLSGASFALATIAALLATALGTALVLRLERPWPRWSWRDAALGLALGLGLAALLLRLLAIPVLHGMVNGGGPDAGTHALFLRTFPVSDPSVYNGFVAFYALGGWFVRIAHADPFEAIRFVTYASAAVPALAAAALSLAGDAAPARPRRLAVLFVVDALGLAWFVFPIVHFFQREAFYGQLIGVVAPLLAWLAYAFLRTPLARVGAAAALVAASRFAYGLNLADLLLTLALLCLRESREMPGRRRWALRSLGGVFALAALPVLRALRPILYADGPDIAHDLLAVVLMELLAAAALLFLAGDPDAPPPLRRAWSFAGRLGLCSGLLSLGWIVAHQPLAYYALKYPFLGVLVTTLGLTVALARQLAGGGWSRRRVVALGCLVPVALLYHRGYHVYIASALERARGRAPFSSFEPLYNPDGWRFVDEVLARSHKKFGGYWAQSFVETHFIHHAKGGAGINDWQWLGDANMQHRGAGYCYFWDISPEHLVRHGVLSARKLLEYELDPARICRTYQPQWEPGQSREMCAICL